MENKTDWYRKLLIKLNNIKEGRLDMDQYIDEVKRKIIMKKKHKINGEDVTRYRCKAEITFGSKVLEPQDYYVQNQKIARIYSLDGESLWEMNESVLEIMDLEKIPEEDHKKSTEIRGTLIEFLDQLRDYFSESGANISQDERESSEFVDIFFKNRDEKFIKDINEKLIVSGKKSMANMFKKVFGKEAIKRNNEKKMCSKYIWLGVNYAEYIGITSSCFTNGKIYRLEQGSTFYLIDDNNHRMQTNPIYECYSFKPSTEEKYRVQEMARQFDLPLTGIEEKIDKILQKLNGL